MSLTDFYKSEYLPHIETTLSPSSVDGYKKLWRSYGEYCTDLELNIKPAQAQAIIRKLYAENPHLSKTSLSHIKAFFSGIWSHALQMGTFDGHNPWRAVKLPAAGDPTETYAYRPDEIEVIVKALSRSKPLDLVVFLAACTGLRKAEIRGLKWSDWDVQTSTLSINRALWRQYEKTTKSRASKAPIPVVSSLAERLEQHRKQSEGLGFIFKASNGAPIDLDNARRIIVPALKGSGVQFKGWHAFRRGLATYLHAKGVPDKEIQAILRHSNIAVTQKCYVHTIPENVRKAIDLVPFK